MNETTFDVDFGGTIVAAGIKGEEFDSLKAQYVPAVLRSLGGRHE